MALSLSTATFRVTKPVWQMTTKGWRSGDFGVVEERYIGGDDRVASRFYLCVIRKDRRGERWVRLTETEYRAAGFAKRAAARLVAKQGAA
jgi:hypothetical protein